MHSPSPVPGAQRVLLALSGGVDSSACIQLLRQSGYDVSACVLSFSPAHAGAVAAARRVAAEAGVPLSVLPCEALFDQQVVLPFCREYAAGRTPSPCPVCNPAVKFRALLQEADRLGIRAIASGHYARVEHVNGTYYVAKAASTQRDQSYMLYRLPQAVLSRLVLPLGQLVKTEVRALAARQGLSSAYTPDSQEICFIPNGDHATYIEERGFTNTGGRLLGPEGQDLGPHRGILHYTVGQRRGLGVALGRPMYVSRIGPNGDVHLAPNEDLFAAGAVLEDVFVTNGRFFEPGMPCDVKIRSMAPAVPCQITDVSSGRLSIQFASPQRAPAPGQHAALYSGPLVMGGGVIQTALQPPSQEEQP